MKEQCAALNHSSRLCEEEAIGYIGKKDYLQFRSYRCSKHMKTLVELIDENVSGFAEYYAVYDEPIIEEQECWSDLLTERLQT